MKRLFDILYAIILLLITLPISIIVAIGIKIDTPGSVVITTKRVGKNGRIFQHLRFRTMAGEPKQKTKFGKIIGNLSIDDIPTLWNVLKGDMSIVGPRPEVTERVNFADPDWKLLWTIKPGMISLGGLTFRDKYNQTKVKERIQPDIYYVKNQSIILDLQIIIRSIFWWIRMGHIKGRF